MGLSDYLMNTPIAGDLATIGDTNCYITSVSLDTIRNTYGTNKNPYDVFLKLIEPVRRCFAVSTMYFFSHLYSVSFSTRLVLLSGVHSQLVSNNIAVSTKQINTVCNDVRMVMINRGLS